MNKTNEKYYTLNYNVGKVKYLVNYYNGEKHNDGSDFLNVKCFNNKIDFNKFIKGLELKGFQCKKRG